MSNKPYIIGITGGTASGKTFVIEALKDYFDGKILVISQDQYYIGERVKHLDRWERANLDQPKAFDNDLLEKHLHNLIAGKTVLAPVYDFAEHKQTKAKVPLEPKAVIILEGLLIFNNEKLRRLINWKVYLEAAPDIRLARRLLRDIEERGVTIENLRSSIEWYMQNVKPMHDKYIHDMKKYADTRLNTDKGSLDAANAVKTKVKDVLKKYE
ncbi:MAG: uridine kinase [Berkelbacteria bacterium GW2011_GWA1_36_9]|uniref:uridine/cytidine kinase n=1 Tax=Berkelbacteria bacterium GW2011_GWA1_36_9 TaxID=1618331 RepID=A0A0G0IPC8_9BACT|nr:MAG: uridine kinase [Berkelbacteria bacterium GW2011_GWA1_36_9]